MNLPKEIYHYSPIEIKELNPNFYENHKKYWPQEACMKPCGIWISIEEFEEDTNWFTWCVAEEFRVDDLKCKHLVTLADDINILYLKTDEEILDFSTEYGTSTEADKELEELYKSIFIETKPYIYQINWLRVQEKYDGIIIAPYQWSLRFMSQTSWYYPWDCASGCIWNIDKVSLQLHETIDTTTLKEQVCQEEENVKDSLLANLAQSP